MSTLKVNSIQSRSGSGTVTLGAADDVISMTGSKVRFREDWTILNANTTLAVGQNYAANTRAGALTLTLPASATIGDVITVIDHEGLASTANNITIATNGNKIDGFDRSAVLNTNRGGISLVFISSTSGWMSDKKEQETQVHRFQGEVSGYTSGGDLNPGGVNTIDKFSFISDGNASDVGDLTQARNSTIGQSSSISGYTSGGYGPGRLNTIDKFPFAVDGNASDVGDLTVDRSSGGAQSSDISGYFSGGVDPSTRVNVIDKFSFTVDGNASDVGDLTQARNDLAGASSEIAGYNAGGNTPPSTNIIDKFPFATDANAVDVGDISSSRHGAMGQSSETNGYASGGFDPRVTTVDKYPFASDANGTNVCDLTQARNGGTGQSSTTNGYTSGGINPTTPPVILYDTIDKFPFATDLDASDVGNLTQARWVVAGQQV